jgi:hypothetical protein
MLADWVKWSNPYKHTLSSTLSFTFLSTLSTAEGGGFNKLTIAQPSQSRKQAIQLTKKASKPARAWVSIIIVLS